MAKDPARFKKKYKAIAILEIRIWKKQIHRPYEFLYWEAVIQKRILRSSLLATSTSALSVVGKEERLRSFLEV